jgi:type VI secretion system secreted protein Hcp
MSTAPEPSSSQTSAESLTESPAEPPIPTQSGPTFFLNLATIPGSATAKGFAGQIPLLTWGWGVDSSATTTGGGGAGTGKPTPQDVVVRARAGIQSPKILTAVNTGRHVPSAVLTCVRPGNRPFTFMTLTFEDVLLTGYYVSPDAQDGVPLDLVHLKFVKVTQKFFTQNPDGTAAQPVVSTFDYRTNTAGP